LQQAKTENKNLEVGDLQRQLKEAAAKQQAAEMKLEDERTTKTTSDTTSMSQGFAKLSKQLLNVTTETVSKVNETAGRAVVTAMTPAKGAFPYRS
jgi:hypothetical protein